MGLKKIRITPPKKTEMGKRLKEANKRLHKLSGVAIERRGGKTKGK